MKIPEQPTACELCRRDIAALTKHHAIPRSLHSNKRVKKQFTKEACITTILWLCRPCHNTIHKVLTEKQMAAKFYTIDALLSQTQIHEFILWIKDKPETFKPKF